MQKTTGSFGPSLAVLLVVFAGVKAVADESQQRRPSFIIFFTDDQGYADVGCFGATDFQTPNFDRLAAEGLKLTSFYAHTHLQAVHDKHWKLVLPRGDGTEDMSFWRGHTTAVEQLQLFNMDSDKEERSNVADKHPQVVSRLLKQIDEGREDIGDYDRTGNGARFWATRFSIETPKQTYQRLKRLERTTSKKGLYGRYVGNFPYSGLAQYGPQAARQKRTLIVFRPIQVVSEATNSQFCAY